MSMHFYFEDEDVYSLLYVLECASQQDWHHLPTKRAMRKLLANVKIAISKQCSTEINEDMQKLEWGNF